MPHVKKPEVSQRNAQNPAARVRPDLARDDLGGAFSGDENSGNKKSSKKGSRELPRHSSKTPIR